MNYYESGNRSRAYHHTAPVNDLFAIDEALRLALDETLSSRWARHLEAANYLYKRLIDCDLELLVAAGSRLAPLTLVKIPDDVAVRTVLLNEKNIENRRRVRKIRG